jgi:hypothetical protein
MRVIIITPEKLMELLQKQQQITMDNGWSSDPLKAFAHPPLPEAVEVPSDTHIEDIASMWCANTGYNASVGSMKEILNQLKLR